MEIQASTDVATSKEKVTFTCTKEVREELQAWADEEGRSLSNLVERIVIKRLKQRADGEELS